MLLATITSMVPSFFSNWQILKYDKLRILTRLLWIETKS